MNWLINLFQRRHSTPWLLAEAVARWSDPVGLYRVEEDDLLILYQNPAAIENLGMDSTGMLLSVAFPSHKDAAGASFGNDPSATLLGVYLEVARTGVPWHEDLCYFADGVAGWYRTRAQKVDDDVIMITWRDVSDEKVSIESKATYIKVQRALMANEFVLHYQPIVSLATNEIAGYEGLVRWPRADGSLRYPGEFIPAIAETELINELCWKVAAIACNELVRWVAEGIHKDCYIAINVAPYTVESPEFESKIYSIIDRHNAPHDKLMVEITEETIIKIAALPRIKRLTLYGIKVGIDDFGTGASSLVRIHDMHFARLIKIDQSFIRDILTNETSQKLVRTIVSLAGELGMVVAAEGVEDEATAEWLKAAGVDYGQGWLWGRAEPLE